MYEPLFNFLQLFQHIPVADQDLISSKLHYRTVRADEYLLREGQICRERYFICKGILRITKQQDDRDVIHFFLKEHQFCTILASFEGGTASGESIQAATEAEVIVMKKNDMEDLYKQVPYLQTLINDITRQALLDKVTIRNAYMGEDATTRYRNFMLRQPDIALRVPLSDVASYLGITQQSLSRIRRNLR